MPASGPQPIFNAELATAAVQPLNVQLGILIEAVNGLNRAATAAPAGLKKMGADIGSILGQVKTGVTASIAIAAGAVGQLVGMVQGAMGQFIEAFRPDVMVRFQIIVKDLMASIGENLVPIMDLASKAFRFIADTIAGMTSVILPSIKMILKAAEPIFNSIKQLIEGTLDPAIITSQAQVITELLTALADPIQQLIGPLVSIIQIFHQVQVGIGSALVGIIAALAPAVGAIIEVVAIIVDVILTPFKILGAVLGPILQVVLLPLTVALRLLAVPFQLLAYVLKPVQVVLAGVVGIITDVGKTAGEVFGIVKGVFGELWALVADFFSPVTSAVQSLFGTIKGAFNDILAWLRSQINAVRGFLGLDPLGEKGKAGNSLGKGAVQASFGSSDDFAKKLMSATYGAGRGEKEDPPKVAANRLNDIWNWIERDLWPFVQGAMDTGKKVAQAGNAVATGDVSTLWTMAKEQWRKTEIMRG